MAKILPTFSVNCMLQTVVQFDRKVPGFILIYQQLSHFSESDCDILFMFPVWNAVYRVRYDILPRFHLRECFTETGTDSEVKNFTCNPEDDPVSLV